MRIVAGMVLVAWWAGSAAADTPRVAFASAASDDAAVAIIESLRLGIANEGLVALGDGELRIALEQPIAAGVEGSLDDAVAALAAAKDSYASFEYDAAMAALDRMDDSLKAVPTSERGLALAADRHLLAGLVHAGRRAEDRAMESFRFVHRIDRSRRELDPGVYAPAVVELYRRALAAPVVRIDVALAIEPAGADVWIDGEPMAAGRKSLPDVEVGLHRVAVAADRHHPSVTVVEITRRTPRIAVTLEPMSPPDQIRRLRALLAGGSVSVGAWQEAGAELARIAAVPVVVIVRRGKDRDTFEAAIFRTANRKLGTWIPVPSARFFAAVHKPVNTTVPATALRGDIAGERSDSRSWYQTWWGRGILLGAGVIAIGGVVYAVTATGENGVDIEDWCFGQECR